MTPKPRTKSKEKRLRARVLKVHAMSRIRSGHVSITKYKRNFFVFLPLLIYCLHYFYVRNIAGSVVEPSPSSCSTSEAQCDAAASASSRAKTMLLPPPTCLSSSSTDVDDEPGGGAAAGTSGTPCLGVPGPGAAETDSNGDLGVGAPAAVRTPGQLAEGGNDGDDSGATVGTLGPQALGSSAAKAATALPRTRHIPSITTIFPKSDGRSCRFELFGTTSLSKTALCASRA